MIRRRDPQREGHPSLDIQTRQAWILLEPGLVHQNLHQVRLQETPGPRLLLRPRAEVLPSEDGGSAGRIRTRQDCCCQTTGVLKGLVNVSVSPRSARSNIEGRFLVRTLKAALKVSSRIFSNWFPLFFCVGSERPRC